MANKGQGLPFNVVVLSGIAVLVLAIIVAFTVGSGGTGLTKLSKSVSTVAPEEKQNQKLACDSLCSQARQSDLSKWKESGYCTHTFALDQNGDGTLADYTEGGVLVKEVNLRCWDAPVASSCRASQQLPSGAIKELTCM